MAHQTTSSSSSNQILVEGSKLIMTAPPIKKCQCINCATDLRRRGRRTRNERNDKIGEIQIRAMLKYLFKLDLNPSFVSNLDQLSLCSRCSKLISTLYQLHLEFDKLTSSISFLGVLLKQVESVQDQNQQHKPPSPQPPTPEPQPQAPSPAQQQKGLDLLSDNEEEGDHNVDSSPSPPDSIKSESELEFDFDYEQDAEDFKYDDDELLEMKESESEPQSPKETEKIQTPNPLPEVIPKAPPIQTPPIQKANKRKSILVPRRDLEEEDQLIECRICPSKTKTRKSEMNRHLAQYHANKDVVKAGGGGAAKYKCSICDKCYDSRFATEVHIASHYQESGEFNDDKEFIRHVTYTCYFCYYVFAIKGIYMNHVQLHLQNNDALPVDEDDAQGPSNSTLSSCPTVSSCSKCKTKLFILNSTTQQDLNCRGERRLLNQYHQAQETETNNTTVHTQGQLITVPTPCKQHWPRFYYYTLPCEICGKTCRSAEAALVHKLSHYAKSELLIAIEQAHSNFTCTCCDTVFAYVASLAHHFRVVHSYYSASSKAKCNACGKVCSAFDESLNRHLTLHARRTLLSLARIVPTKIRIKDCTECRLKILGAPTNHEDNEEEEPNIYVGQQVLFRCNTHKIGLKPRFLCTICGTRMANQNQLKIHKYRHLAKEEQMEAIAGRRKYLCTICGAGFIQEASLEHHTLNAHELQHESPRQYKCTFSPSTCSMSFRTKSSWKNHVKLHKAGQLFTCTNCSASFDLESGLKDHVKFYCSTLSSIRPHCCEVCNKKFSNPKTLRRHKSDVHQLTSVLGPRSCHLCFNNKKYPSGTSLRIHFIKRHRMNGVEARRIAFPHLPAIGESERAEKRRRKEELLLQKQQQNNIFY